MKSNKQLQVTLHKLLLLQLLFILVQLSKANEKTLEMFSLILQPKKQNYKCLKVFSKKNTFIFKDYKFSNFEICKKYVKEEKTVF